VGLLVDGKWQDTWYDTKSTGGRFVRQKSNFRRTVRSEPDSEFPAEPGRYHLYVSLACPWAHRTLIVRKLKKLEDVIGVVICEPVWAGQGWHFAESGPTADPLYGIRHMHELYTRAQADFTGRVTVPVLWDAQKQNIVNNESSEIIRMLNSAFDAWGDASVDFYPEPLRDAIDAINERVYGAINNGVYRTGFASTQEAYAEAFEALFSALDELEELLATSRYLVGDRITEADWRLFATLVRFDAVYVAHFKCNRRRIVDYPNLWGYTRELYQVPGVAETVDMRHNKEHYFCSHERLNPSGIVPLGPTLDFTTRHGRDRLRSRQP